MRSFFSETWHQPKMLPCYFHRLSVFAVQKIHALGRRENFPLPPSLVQSSHQPLKLSRIPSFTTTIMTANRAPSASTSSQPHFSSIEDTISAFARNEFVIVLDDEDRENEGDLLIAAAGVTTEQMAFLVRHSSGFVCISIHPSIVAHLGIPMMVPRNEEKHKTAYTVTLDYRHGTTTGISAHDRALTSRMLAKAHEGALRRERGEEPRREPLGQGAESDDFSKPGHLNPLRYTEGGVRVRKGHTEASVDLCIAASLPPAALLCELVDPEDPQGGIAARDACLRFAQEHSLCVTTIEALIKWREQQEGQEIPGVDAVLLAKRAKGSEEANKELERSRGTYIEEQKVVGPSAGTTPKVNGSS